MYLCCSGASGGSSAGAIAGGVIGGIVVVIIIVIIIIILYKLCVNKRGIIDYMCQQLCLYSSVLCVTIVTYYTVFVTYIYWHCLCMFKSVTNYMY